MDKKAGGKLSFLAIADYECLSSKDGFRIVSCGALASWLGYTEEELNGKLLGDIIMPDSGEEILQMLTDRTEQTESVDIMLPFRKKDGTEVWTVNFSRIETDGQGDVHLYNIAIPAPETGAMFSNMQEQICAYSRKLSQNECLIGSLKIRVSQDSLTRILNAASTRGMAEEYLSSPDRNCAVFVIDMDNFKQINDIYGHIIGDEILICVAGVIRKLFRSNDIVGRVGGDEFFVLMKDIKDRSIIDLRCAQIVSALREVRAPGNDKVRISCSVGAAICPTHGTDYNSLFSIADQAMYRSKNSGRNCYSIEDCQV